MHRYLFIIGLLFAFATPPVFGALATNMTPQLQATVVDNDEIKCVTTSAKLTKILKVKRCAKKSFGTAMTTCNLTMLPVSKEQCFFQDTDPVFEGFLLPTLYSMCASECFRPPRWQIT
jgi:hypothetical protein